MQFFKKEVTLTKRFLMVLVILVMVFYTNVTFAEEEIGIRIPKNAMEQALAADDATVLIKDYLIPYLSKNDMAVIIFGSEINLSNGRTQSKSQYDRSGLQWAMSESEDARLYFEKRLQCSNEEPIPFGERGMLGKLIYAPSILLEYDTILSKVDFIREETIRLLVGPKLHKGRGTISFKFSEASNAKILSYETSTWSKPVRHVLTIKIDHIPEYMGEGHRYRHLECDWKNCIDNSYYLATFRIVRKN